MARPMILRNVFSMTGLSAIKAVVSLFVSVAIAGIVAPEQYGLIAFVVPLVSLITILTDLGLASAIVVRPQLDLREAGAAIILMTGGGLLGAVTLALASKRIESALSLQGLTPVLIGVSLATAFSMLATGPRALLERGLEYTKVAIIESGALISGIAAFVVGVKASLGILALVGYYVAVQAVRAVAFVLLARPLFELSLEFRRVSGLVNVGGWLFLTNLLGYCARNIDNLLIGGVLGAASLGLYGLAYQFMTVPLVLMSWPISGVLLAILARMQHDATQKADVVCAVITGTAAVSFPMMTFMTFGAQFPIEVAYADRWNGLTDIIGILAPVGALQSIAAFNGAVLVERGAIRLYFYLGLVNGLVLSGVFVCTVWFGLHVLVRAYAVSATLLSLLLIYYMCREAGIALRRFGSCLIPGLVASIGGTLCVAFVTGLSLQTAARWTTASVLYIIVVIAVFGFYRRPLLESLRVLSMRRAKIASFTNLS